MNIQKVCQIEELPVIDFDDYMGKDLNDPKLQAVCKQVAECLHQYGILIVRDPRVNEQDNSDYIDMMEKYFESRGNQLYSGQELEDAKPECHYQVGVCPEIIEKARDHSQRMRRYTEENKPQSPEEPVFDAKWRFMWKIGQRPEEASDNFPQVIPKDFPDWEHKMNKWGYKMFDAVSQVAEMAAIGLGLSKETFTNWMKGGAHLLAPTGSDLKKNDIGAVLAGFHYDIAFLTIHGKSRYPGLYVWTRDNKKMQVKVPNGCLILQAGKTFEHITGGYVLAGFHEVIYTQLTKDAYEKKKAEINDEDRTIWRVSSTMFTHFRYDVDCSPLAELSQFHSENAVQLYPKMKSYDILMTELSATNMVQETSNFDQGITKEKDQTAF